MTRGDSSLTEMIVGKWIHADTDGETVTTDMKSVYTFEKISGNDLRFTAKTTLSKNAAPTAPPTPPLSR